MDVTLPERVRVCVVGAGFAGLGTAHRLLREGETSFVVLERADAVGGTWRDNRYPGAACDVPSALYSFSFAPNPDWSHVFSRGPEIKDYLERVADERGLRPYLRLSTELLGGTWDDEELLWRLETSRGPLLADVLVSGCGGLVEPALPEVPGVGTFAGPEFHSAQWREDVDLRGKRVAVVGSGASVAQFLPVVREQAERTVVLQRTPPWVLPRRDREIGPRTRALFRRVPAAQRAARAGVYALRETWLRGFRGDERVRGIAEAEALRHLEASVPDPDLRARLTPDYALGCKRVVLSDDYLTALASPDVTVVTSGLAEVRPEGVVDGDGVLHEVDVVVHGTGFHPMRLSVAPALVGRDGLTLAEAWDKAGAQAHRGTTVHGFPNLFLLLGPNTALGHTSVVLMIEAQIEYVADALRLLQRTGTRAVEVRRAAQEAWNRMLAEQLDTTVWNRGGCRAWYRDVEGRNFTLWPGHTWTFRRLLRTVDAESYELRGAR